MIWLQEDSGGPLFSKANGHFQLYGVTSDLCSDCYSGNKGYEKSHIVFSIKIAFAYDWIVDVINMRIGKDRVYFQDIDC